MRSLHLALLLLLIAWHIPISASARHPRGLRLTGVIVRVDHSTRTVAFEEDGIPAIKHFVYAARATFWDGTTDASVQTLKPGMRVEITLHNPVFGPDFATRIIRLRS